MSEETEKKSEGEEEKKPDEDTDTGDKPKADAEVEQLNADTERINKAIAENENAKARQKLGGVSEAGQEPKKPKEETPEEYADRVMEGGNEK